MLGVEARGGLVDRQPADLRGDRHAAREIALAQPIGVFPAR
ncbi:MAG TPA: hypothetical protein VNI83_12770 [Vicinamibacterales bacterium]|nr:hypothetical protein [Vicinamibacterales bacterium]